MNEVILHSIPRSVWYGWGDPKESSPLTSNTTNALGDQLGITVPTTDIHSPVSPDEVKLPVIRLTEDDVQALQDVVGDSEVHTDNMERIMHASGKAYPDLYRLYHGDGSLAPDAVVTPKKGEDIEKLLDLCGERDIAVITFGGGTSVVGGVNGTPGGHRAVISLDMRHFNKMLDYDPVSKLATLQAGMRGPEFEAALSAHGVTLGHYPQSHQEATIGGYAATRSAGQASTGYGRSDDNIIGLTAITPTGTMHIDGRSPGTAAGPQLREVMVGSEGTLGVITDVKVKVTDLPSEKAYAAWALPSTAAAIVALRGMTQEMPHGDLPTVCRWSDPDETEASLVQTGSFGKALMSYLKVRGLDTPTILILTWEGKDSRDLKRRQRVAEGYIKAVGAKRLPSLITKKWEAKRFSGPYLRDKLMNRGILADTLETATTWDNLENLHDEVGDAIHEAFAKQGREVLVMSHISHVYESGASLYYTFVAKETDDPIAQWTAVKTAACEAIQRAGGTITHHHAVGTDHRPYLEDEIGTVGVRMLQALKSELDPKGILNPGKLIPELKGDNAANNTPSE